MPSGNTYLLLHQTEITIDVVRTERQRGMLNAQPMYQTAGGGAVPIPQISLATTTLPSMRAGTTPLAFITSSPEGLLDVITANARAGAAENGDPGAI